jgi:acetyl-CoA C-acetyltransferase
VEGTDLESHAATVAALWASASRVAAGNPDAWVRDAVDAATIRAARPLAFPYGTLHTSQWTVDQAAGLVFCSLGTARALGVRDDRLVFPLAVADANFMAPLVARAALHRSPGFAAAGRAVLERAGTDVACVRHLELYSCFPAAVRVQQRELGVPVDRPFTLTGGMAFAGGPLNSFVLHALVTLARTLRADPGSRGLLTAVSGIVTKQGASLWSTEPPAGPVPFDDVTDVAQRETAIAEVVGDATGEATIASYTVLYAGQDPSQAVVVCDLPDGRRTMRASRDVALADAMTRTEHCGRRVRLAGDGGFDVVG